MKIAFCTWKFPALANTFILNEIVEVLKRGHEAWIYSIDRSDDEVVNDDVERYGLLKRALFLDDFVTGGPVDRGVAKYGEDWLSEKLTALAPVANRMRRDGVQVVHGCFMNNSATVAMVTARLAGLPLTVECHAHDVFVDLRFAKEKISAADRIFSISDYNKRHLVDDLGCQPDKVVIRRVPILAEFCDAIGERTREEGLVVTVGRLHPIKGLHTALEAFARVAEKNDQARFLIIGDGEERESLEAKVDTLSLRGCVEFAGHMTNEESLARVASASAFLLPSEIAKDGDRDGIPTSLIESMYLRTPAVSTHVSGIPELIRDGENGFLAPPGDVAEIAAKLERLLGDKELRTELGEKARATVVGDFGVGRNIGILIDHWAEVIENRPQGLIARLLSR